MKITERWKALQGPARASVVFVLASFLLRGISFLTTPIFTRLVDQAQYGLIVTYNNWSAIVEVFAVLGMTSAGVFNIGLNDYRNDQDRYISSVLVLCTLADIITFALLFLFRRICPEILTLPDHLLLLMGLHFILYPAQVFWITRERYAYRYRAAAIISVLSTILSTVVAILAVLYIPGENKGEIRLWSGELVVLAFSLPIYIMLLARGKCFADTVRWKKILAYALPLLPHYLAQHIMNNSDRIMVNNLVSESAAAVYALAVMVSMVMTMIWSAVNGSLVPYTYEKMNAGETDSIRRISIPLVLFYGILCFGVILITPELFLFLAPETYRPGIYAVPPVASVAFLSAMYNLLANVEFYCKKARWITLSTVTAAIVNVVLNAIFIPKYGFVAAAYTTLVSYLVLLVMHWLGYWKCTPVPIYDMKTLTGICAVIVCACLLCGLTYETVLLRYGIVAVLLLLALLKRKIIITKLKELKKPASSADAVPPAAE